MKLTQLKCEHLDSPMGVDCQRPVFSAIAESCERDIKIKAYQLQVTQSEDWQDMCWDSGKVESGNLACIVYDGLDLTSNQNYRWRIKAWYGDKESDWNDQGRFHTGLFQQSQWQGKLITGKNYLRRTFHLEQLPKNAVAFFAPIGYGELYINGEKVGNHVLDPGFTPVKKRTLYLTHDILKHLKSGENTIGVLLGNVRWGSTAFKLQLECHDNSGAKKTVVSDLDWKTSTGPLVSDHIYHGETYDARKEIHGWNAPGFNDENWESVRESDLEVGEYSSQMMPPIRKVVELPVKLVSNPGAGTYIFDCGQNLSGWTRLEARGERGSKIQLRHAENLTPDGRLDTGTVKGAKATDTYIMNGEGLEIYEPRFTYHGFRYVEVKGYPGIPTPDSLKACLVHTDVKPIGQFSCSNQLLNQIQQACQWGYRTNLHSIPTDCCNRFERQGWLGDAHITVDMGLKNFDGIAFYKTFIRSMVDEQDESGAIPDTVPHYCVGNRPADPVWGAALPIILWSTYLHSGDVSLLENFYQPTRNWLESELKRCENHLVKHGIYGDWISSVESDQSFISTAFIMICTQIQSKMARILNFQEDEHKYREELQAMKRAIHARYFNTESITYSRGTQTENALAIWLDIVPEEHRGTVHRRLDHDIVWHNDTHTTSGFIGIKYVMESLDIMNRSDIAYDLAKQDTYPSWGYMIKKGATTLWELWQHKTSVGMNSHNHPMLGSISNWFYNTLAGIRIDESRPAYSNIVISPKPCGDLKWASGSIETKRGMVWSQWEQKSDGFKLKVSIPAGTQAEIGLPKNLIDEAILIESGKIIWQSDGQENECPGVHDIKCENNTVLITCGSGNYDFDLSEKEVD